MLAFGLGAFCVAGIVRAGHRGCQRPAAARCTSRSAVRGSDTVRGNPRRYGGAGRAPRRRGIAVGLAARRAARRPREVQPQAGQSARAPDHRVTYLGSSTHVACEKTTISTRVRSPTAAQQTLGTLHPAISSFPNFPDGIGTPDIHSDLWHDVYLTFVSAPTSGGAGGAVTIGIQVGTFVMWLWIGGVIMALGILIALTPQRKRRPIVKTPSPPADETLVLAEAAP